MRPSEPRMAMPNGADWKKRAKRAPPVIGFEFGGALIGEIEHGDA